VPTRHLIQEDFATWLNEWGHGDGVVRVVTGELDLELVRELKHEIPADYVAGTQTVSVYIDAAWRLYYAHPSPDIGGYTAYVQFDPEPARGDPHLGAWHEPSEYLAYVYDDRAAVWNGERFVSPPGPYLRERTCRECGAKIRLAATEPYHVRYYVHADTGLAECAATPRRRGVARP
jgi:hypothetical protein